MKKIKSDPWFPAKTYGWGWGLPITWQGWLVMVVFLLAVVVAAQMHDAGALSTPLLVLILVLLSALMFGICYLTGEKPRWRWGKDE